jgi:Family of unknown function (DUF6481)
MSFQDPDHQHRQSAAAAKQAMLQKFRAASEDPEVARRHAARAAMNEARLVRIAEREAAKRTREAELAEQATRAAELAAQTQREAEEAEALLAAQSAERAILLEAEQKAARDARYAARKAAKKERRRGY